MTQPTIGNLNPLFEPSMQAADAIQQDVLTSTLNNSVGDNLMALMRRSSINQPAAPALNFNVNARNVGEGVVQGLGNGINNAMQLGQFRRAQEQRQAAIDLAQRYDLAAAQKKQQDLATGNNALAILANPNATPVERLTAFQGLNAVSGGEFAKTMGSQFATPVFSAGGNRAAAPDQGAADALKKASEFDALMKKVQEIGPLEVNGIPQPQAVRAYQALFNRSPYTSLDANKEVIDLNRANVGLKMDQNELGAQPGKLKREALGEELGLSIQKVTAKYAEANALIDKLTGENKLKEAQELRTRLDEGRKRYDQAISAYDSLTPGQVKLLNSRFKSMDLPYELPEKKEGTLKAVTKDGKVQEFYDPETGRIVPAQR